MNWMHPTKQQPKTVALVCLGPSRNAYVSACLENDLSEATQGVDEVWTLNRGATLFRHDLLFVMDHITGEAERFPRYGAALWKHDRPIITSDTAEDWPAHVHSYPFNAIWDWLRKGIQPMHGDWFHNSVAYILVYAAFVGVREIRVFGADYTSHSSGVVEDGHPCVAYWTGKLESVGLVVRPCAGSNFLNVAQRDWIYGYRHDPRRIPANRARFRAMTGQMADPESTALQSGERQVAANIENIQPDHVARYQWAAPRVSGRVIDFGAGIGYGSAMLADFEAVSDVVAVERSQESIEYAKTHYARENVHYLCMDLDNSEFNVSQRFDCATAFEIIEHLANPRPFLQSIPADWLFASVPNETVIPYNPETAPFHHRHYTQEQFWQLLHDCGWDVIEWAGQDSPVSPVRLCDPEKSRTLIVQAKRRPT